MSADFMAVSDEAVRAVAIKLSAEDELVIATLLAERNVLARMLRLRREQVAQLVKEFAFEHRLFGNVVVYAESSPPPWMLHAENRRFWTQHVLTLAVGQSTETEWHKIRRIK